MTAEIIDTDAGFSREELELDPGFAQVPHGLWLHPELSYLERCLLGWLWSHDKAFLAKLSTREIRRQFNGSGAIPAALQHLVELGFLTKGKGARNRTTYRLMAAPWKALFGHRQEAQSSGPDRGPAGQGSGPDRGPVTGPDRGPEASRDLDHIEDHLEDQGEDQSLSSQHATPQRTGDRRDDDDDDGSSDDETVEITALVTAKLIDRTNRTGQQPRRGYGLRCAANLQPGGTDRDQLDELRRLRTARPELDLETAAGIVVGLTPDPAIPPVSAAPVVSIEERQARSLVAGFVLAGQITEARDWIANDCPPSARAAAEAELERRTGRTAS